MKAVISLLLIIAISFGAILIFRLSRMPSNRPAPTTSLNTNKESPPSSPPLQTSTSRHGEGVSAVLNSASPKPPPHHLMRAKPDLDAILATEGIERSASLESLAHYLAGFPIQEANKTLELIANQELQQAENDAFLFARLYAKEKALIDPELAAGWALALPSHSRHAALNQVATVWSKMDIDGFEAWFDSVEDKQARSTLIRSAGKLLMNFDTEFSGRSWAEYLSTQADGMTHSDVVAELWAKSDPEATFNWLAGLEDLGAQNTGWLHMARSIAADHPKQAAKWVEQFPNADVRSHAVLSTTDIWARTSPREAAEWLESVDQGRHLEAGIGSVYSSWKETDAKAAKKWLNGLDMNENTKDYLLSF